MWLWLRRAMARVRVRIRVRDMVRFMVNIRLGYSEAQLRFRRLGFGSFF